MKEITQARKKRMKWKRENLTQSIMMKKIKNKTKRKQKSYLRSNFNTIRALHLNHRRLLKEKIYMFQY